MTELQKKEKEEPNKNQISEEYSGGQFEKDQEGEYKMRTGQIKENKGSTSKCSIKEGKDTAYLVQQGIRESTVDGSNTIDLTIMPLDKNKEKSYKKVIHNERSKEYNESKKELEQEVSFEEERLEKQEEEEEDINDEFELNIITSNDSLPDKSNHIQKDNNTNRDSKLPISDEKDQNYYRLKQGVPRSTKLRSIIDIYKHTKRLSSPEKEYKWSRSSTLENGKMGKDQVNTIEEIQPNKQKQILFSGEFENIGEHSQEDNSYHTLMKDKIDNRSNLSMKDNKDEGDHSNKGISESTMFKSLFDLCEVIIQHETSRSEEHGVSITRKDHEDSIEVELPEEQQQQQNDITGEPELNKVTGEVSLPKINPDCVLNNNDANCGSKLLARDENDGNYRITQGIPRSIKFRSINNLYECTTRLSPVELEYNWNLPRGEYSKMNHLKKEDSSNKKNFDCKRKCRENQKGKGEKDATA